MPEDPKKFLQQASLPAHMYYLRMARPCALVGTSLTADQMGDLLIRGNPADESQVMALYCVQLSRNILLISKRGRIGGEPLDGHDQDNGCGSGDYA